MKNKLFILISGLFLLNSCFVGIKKTIDVPIEKQVFVKQIQDSTISRIMISQNSLDTSNFSLHYQYYLKTDSIWKDSVNQNIAHFIFLSSNFEDTEKKNFEISNQFFVACLDSFYAQGKQDYENSEYSTLWDYDANCQILDEHKLFVTLSNSIYTYTGGAHGNGYQEYVHIDKTTGKSLSLADFVTNIEEFTKLSEKEFRKALEIKEEENLEDLGFWFPENKFYCNDNFYFMGDSISFFFNSYEIAPYSMGQSEFSIPLNKIKHLLKIDLSKN
ncbi:MAG: RsiV family protein [Bacteroidota bacterium]